MNSSLSNASYDEDSVKSLQEKLKIAGYWKGPIDGNYTDELHAALKKFQDEHNIHESAEAEVDTVKTLQKYARAHEENMFSARNTTVVWTLAVIFCVGLGYLGWWQNTAKARELLPTAEKFVDEFYKYYNRQDIDHIYSRLGGDKLHGQIKYEDFSEFLRKTFDGMGRVKEWEQGHWQFDEQGEDTFLIIQYMTQREKKNAKDNIVLQRRNGKWYLVGYSVNSDF